MTSWGRLPSGNTMKRRLLCLAFLACVVVSVSARGKVPPLDLNAGSGGGQRSLIIEKQSWWLGGGVIDPDHVVRNTTSCTWDINDHMAYASEGYLGPGASSGRQDCHVFDFTPIEACRSGVCMAWSFPSNWVGMRVQASTTDVSVSLCFDPQDVCFTASPVYDKSLRLYTYDICAQAVYNPDDAAVGDIVGSNGGRGVPTRVTRTVTNLSGRTIRTITARWGLTSDAYTAPGCPSFPASAWSLQRVYPWSWIGVRIS